MSSRVPSYLRTLRRAWGLTQSEVARLIGSRNRSHVSRLERGRRTPSIDAFLAYVVLFGTAPEKLTPQKYSHIKEEVLRNAAALLEEIADDSSLRGERKRQLLSQALARAITSSPHQGV